MEPWFFFPEPDMDQYSVNYTGKCIVTARKGNTNCYIVNTENKFPRHYDLIDEIVQKLDAFPPVNEVFLVALECRKVVFRAVRAIDSIDSKYYIRLIDLAENMAVGSPDDLEMFSISKRAQKEPSQAIPCRVVEIRDEEGELMDIDTGLEYVVGYESSFTIKAIENSKANNNQILIISLQMFYGECSDTESKQSNNGHETIENEYKMTKDQIDVLYEDEIHTSNASKAILGYVPHDEERICPFYNETTGRCFKGNSCRLEHLKPLDDGTTRDRIVAHFKLVPRQLMPEPGTVFKGYVTWASGIDNFYIIPKCEVAALRKFEKDLNTKVQRTFYKKIKRYLGPGELVMFIYDGKFRRGRVNQLKDDMVSIFFIDHGATKMIPIGDVYEWCGFSAPAFVYGCILADIHMSDDNEETMQQIQSILTEETEFDVHIVDMKKGVDDLYVQLSTENDGDLGKKLCRMGLTVESHNIIPADTNYCYPE